ncbi:MAG TPA: pantoate--beta-alanine ligase [Brumimicrobium sp.]|nr:pantoate--beta-alanine ligase [Brumimicrobium sp.]
MIYLIKQKELLESLRSIDELDAHLVPLRKAGAKIGFVPTMGALHDGHIALVKAAKQDCDAVIVSIFVNPTQFNNADDLKHYPRQEDEDLALLLKNNCDFVYLPTAEEIYPADYKAVKVDLETIENTMEGKHRPGHFDGVVNVVSRLFDIVQPNKAYFGRKDFQQVAVVKEMNRQLKLPVEIVTVETKRTSSGLALSSRNLRLSEQSLEKAVIISQVLNKGKSWANSYSPSVTRDKMIAYFKDSSLELEYLQIVHPDTLNDLNQYWVPGATACIATYCDDVRLIDNMELIAK